MAAPRHEVAAATDGDGQPSENPRGRKPRDQCADVFASCEAMGIWPGTLPRKMPFEVPMVGFRA